MNFKQDFNYGGRLVHQVSEGGRFRIDGTNREFIDAADAFGWIERNLSDYEHEPVNKALRKRLLKAEWVKPIFYDDITAGEPNDAHVDSWIDASGLHGKA